MAENIKKNHLFLRAWHKTKTCILSNFLNYLFSTYGWRHTWIFQSSSNNPGQSRQDWLIGFVWRGLVVVSCKLFNFYPKNLSLTTVPSFSRIFCYTFKKINFVPLFLLKKIFLPNTLTVFMSFMFYHPPAPVSGYVTKCFPYQTDANYQTERNKYLPCRQTQSRWVLFVIYIIY